MVARQGEAPRILTLAPEQCIALDGRVVLGLYRAPIQGPRVGDVRRAMEAAAQLASPGLISIGVFRLSPEFPLGTGIDTNLKELGELVRTLDRVVAAYAIVIEFGGVRAAAMRVLTRAVVKIARPRGAMADFDGLTDAVRWLRPHAERAGALTEHAGYLRLYRAVERELGELDERRSATGGRSARA